MEGTGSADHKSPNGNDSDQQDQLSNDEIKQSPADENAPNADSCVDADKVSKDLSSHTQKQSVAEASGKAVMEPTYREAAELGLRIKLTELEQRVSGAEQLKQLYDRLDEKLERFEAAFEETKHENETPTPAQRQPASSKLNYLPWTKYIEGIHRGRDLNLTEDYTKVIQKEHFAIDILRGDPIMWWQKEKSKNQASLNAAAQRKDLPSEPGTMPLSPEDPHELRPLPDRIRINSRPLLRLMVELSDIRDPGEWLERPWSFRRPYKMLLYCEDKLRAKRDELREKFTPSVGNSENQIAEFRACEGLSLLKRENTFQNDDLQSPTARPLPAKVDTKASLEDSPEFLRDLECLLEFMDKFLSARINRYQKQMRPKIRFEDLWYLFVPGDHIISKQHPSKVWRILTTSGGRQNLATSETLDDDTAPPKKPEANPFVIHCYYVDFDGKGFGPVEQDFQIETFENEKEVNSLKVFPFRYDNEHETMRKALVKRGRDFLECVKKPQIRYFKGRTLNRDWKGETLKDNGDNVLRSEDVNARVIIDLERAFRNNYSWTPTLNETRIPGQYTSDTRETLQKITGHCDKFDWCDEDLDGDFYWEVKKVEDMMDEQPLLKRQQDYMDLSEDDLMILSGQVFGFILRSRRWACFPLDMLQEVQPSRKGFEDLQLKDNDHKKSIEALVKTHLSHKLKKETDRVHDLVAGKECMADYTAKPLLPITSGDLGVRAEMVQKTLEENFQLAQAWDCILLLDEADVFLTSRDKSSLERNSLVSVFLRTLEYYTGILFLTTNRVGYIDEAVKSRISLSLYYPALDLTQALKIWNLNLDRILETRSPTLEADDRQRIELYQWAYSNLQDQRTGGIIWNGRQIRNAVSTAAALAEFEVQDPSNGKKAFLETRFFDIVMKATQDFDDYLLATRGKSDEELMAMGHIRSRENHHDPRPVGGTAIGANQRAPTSSITGPSAMQHNQGTPGTMYPQRSPTPSPFQSQTASSLPYQSWQAQPLPSSNSLNSQAQGQGMFFNGQSPPPNISQYQQQQPGQYDQYRGYQDPARASPFAQQPSPGQGIQQPMPQGPTTSTMPPTPLTASLFNSSQTTERGQTPAPSDATKQIPNPLPHAQYAQA